MKFAVMRGPDPGAHSAVGVATVPDCGDEYDHTRFLDPVYDPVLAATCRVKTLQLPVQRLPDAPRILCERPEDELEARRCDRLGQILVDGTPGRT